MRGHEVGAALCERRGQGTHFFLVGAVVGFDSVLLGKEAERGGGVLEGRGGKANSMMIHTYIHAHIRQPLTKMLVTGFLSPFIANNGHRSNLKDVKSLP